MKKTLGVIMDGNRRFAKKHNLSEEEAYAKGGEKLLEVLKWAKEEFFTDVIAYAFSKDNWKRNFKEESFFKALKKASKEKLEGLNKEQIRISYIGDIDKFGECAESLKEIEEKTKENKGIHLWLALSYSGRDDIEQAAKKGNIAENLSTKDCEDPQLIIRTGGLHRLSGFLLWEAQYSTLFFGDELWPEFSKEEFKRAIAFMEKQKQNKGI